MSGLPSGWVEATIRDLCELINGKAFKPSDWTTDGLPIVRIQNLNNPKSNFNHYQGLVEEKFLIEDGQLLFAWSGTPGTSFGAHVWNGGRAVLNQHIFKVNFPVDLIDKHFLSNAINQKLEELIGKAHGGAGLQHVTKGKFEDTLIYLPPLAEQKRLVAKLDALNAKSARARAELARIETLVSRYKQAVLSKAFSGELTREWRGQNRLHALDQDEVLQSRRDWLASQGLKAIEVSVANVSEDKVPFAVPGNWIWITAEGLSAPITKGTTPAKENMSAGTGVIPFIKVYNLTFDGTLDFSRDPTFVSQDTHSKELKRSIVKPGDVLMNIVGPPLGKVSIVPDDWPEWNVNQAIAIFRPLAFLNNRYLGWWLLSDSMLSWAKRDSKATAGQSNLTLELCRSIPVPTCHIEEQHEIVRRIESAFAKIDRLAKEAKRALELVGRLDEAILAKAFRGELVLQDENDEPAEHLLARIRAEREATPKGKRGRGARG